MIHLAGDYDPKTGQHCIRCGLELARPRHLLAWEQGQDPPSGWEDGSEVLEDGNFWYSVKDLIDSPQDPHCETV